MLAAIACSYLSASPSQHAYACVQVSLPVHVCTFVVCLQVLCPTHFVIFTDATVTFIDLLARQSFSTASSPRPPHSEQQDTLPLLPQQFSLFIVFRSVPNRSFHLFSAYSRNTSLSTTTSPPLQQQAPSIVHNASQEQRDVNRTALSSDTDSRAFSNATESGTPAFEFESSLTLGPDINVLYEQNYTTVWQNIALYDEDQSSGTNDFNQTWLLLTVDHGEMTSCLNGQRQEENISLWEASKDNQVLLVFDEEMYFKSMQVYDLAKLMQVHCLI